MTQTKTKKALLMSVLSMVLCVAMLVGMTFAWFTDTASTGVNKIQAGELKINCWVQMTKSLVQPTHLHGKSQQDTKLKKFFGNQTVNTIWKHSKFKMQETLL